MFHDWTKGGEDGGLGLSFGLSRSHRFRNKPPKKPWDPREANLMTYQVNHTTATRLVERIERVKHERFFQAPLESPHTLPYVKKGEVTETLHLMTDNPRKPPFPFLRRPMPPPFPLPTFEGSGISLETSSVSNSIPKIPSLVRQISDEPAPAFMSEKVNARVKSVVLKQGKTKINVDTSVGSKKKIKKTPVQLAEKTMEWERQLRIPSLGRPSTSYPTTHEVTKQLIKQKQELVGLKKSQQKIMHASLFTDVIKKKQMEELKRIEEHDVKKQAAANDIDTTTYYQMAPKTRAIPNRTIEVAEIGIDQHQIKGRTLRLGPRFPMMPKLTKFFVRDGIPTMVEPTANTFGSPDTLRIPFKGTSSSRRPHKFVVEMVEFKDKELSFQVDGHLIIVTGQRPKDKTKNRRLVTETIILPMDLSLNDLRIVRDYTGRVVIEELWDF